MKRIALVLAGTAVLTVVFSFITGVNAQNRAGAQWQYAYVAYASYPVDVAVFYVEDEGCRSEAVQVDPVRSQTNWGSTDRYATQAKAVALAVRTLGVDGWEMIGEGYPYCAGRGDKAIHFKRAMR